MRRPVLVVAALALAGAMAGCGSSGGDDAGSDRACSTEVVAQVRGARAAAPSRDPAPLTWADCRAGKQVAALAVPVDHDDPAAGTLVLALARRPASGERVGTLVVNPGGPGAGALALALGADDVFPTEVTEHFDVVAFDPRGVGLSDGVDCADDATMAEWWTADRTPDDAAEREALLAAARSIAEGCGAAHADVLPHLATIDTVRDLEAVRIALGEEQLSFLGFSYGTLIGARYADEHPDRVQAMVLDAAVDPARDPARMVAEQAAGFEGALDAFLDDCAADEDCAFFSGGDPHRAYDLMMAAIDAEELYAVDAGGTERGLGPGEADLGVASALYAGSAGWPRLAEALVGAARGDASELLRLADEYTRRSAAGVYADELEASYAIGCLDGPRPTVEELAALATELARELPRFGAATAWYGAPCAFWPATAAADDAGPTPVRATGAPPILVVGTTGDPATPYEWAEALTAQLESATLLTREGEGHAAYLSGNSCVDDAVHVYLVDLEPPEAGARC